MYSAYGGYFEAKDIEISISIWRDNIFLKIIKKKYFFKSAYDLGL